MVAWQGIETTSGFLTKRAELQCGKIKKWLNPLKGVILKLKLQYFSHLMRRADSLEKILMLGKIGGRRRRGLQRIRWLDGITDLMDMGLVHSRSW